ncbi:cytidine deaminase [bacterium]|nr:cytidine deaminase [bacterium]
MNIDYNLLMNKAKEASANSYSPFSRFAVGAAVLTNDGEIYQGCNVENSSFGLTICAERCAIFKAISDGKREIVAVAIYSPNADSCYPCGACRQVMYEFQGDNEEISVITENLGQLEINKLSYFLPCGFRI